MLGFRSSSTANHIHANDQKQQLVPAEAEPNNALHNATTDSLTIPDASAACQVLKHPHHVRESAIQRWTEQVVTMGSLTCQACCNGITDLTLPGIALSSFIEPKSQRLRHSHCCPCLCSCQAVNKKMAGCSRTHMWRDSIKVWLQLISFLSLQEFLL